MKNKLYYLLAVLYVLMFGFILYINGIFTEAEISVSNLVINIGFLLVIGVLFLLSFASFGQLNRLTDALVFATEEMQEKYEAGQKNLWKEYRQKKDLFPNPILNRQFGKYQKRIQIHTSSKGVITEVCPIEEYINEELIDQVGKTYFNSAVSGTLTGLGILGTFLGLTLGMSSFSGNDIFTISDNIAPLLDGMKVAFHTSVYGIFFSLVFTFVYRSLMSDAYEKLSDFLSAFHEYAAPTASNTDENMSAMLIYQANMANSLKNMMELMRGNAAEQVKGVEQIIQQFMDRLTNTMNTDFESLGNSLRQACEAQGTYARNFQRLEESTRILLEASRSMSDTMNLALDRQREIEAALSRTCEDLNNELYTFHQMRDLYEK
ncbi:MAG: MotA/TolQ/ExbB proton channel family protein [Lachnospiraceae bacterium]|nr:MotA/TolQ/ExbB proton channel family protein [Lachnospiraceae bacterium]